MKTGQVNLDHLSLSWALPWDVSWDVSWKLSWGALGRARGSTRGPSRGPTRGATRGPLVAQSSLSPALYVAKMVTCNPGRLHGRVISCRNTRDHLDAPWIQPRNSRKQGTEGYGGTND